MTSAASPITVHAKRRTARRGAAPSLTAVGTFVPDAIELRRYEPADQNVTQSNNKEPVAIIAKSTIIPAHRTSSRKAALPIFDSIKAPLAFAPRLALQFSASALANPQRNYGSHGLDELALRARLQICSGERHTVCLGAPCPRRSVSRERICAQSRPLTCL